MNKIKRYNPIVVNDLTTEKICGVMEENDKGDYIKYTDLHNFNSHNNSRRNECSECSMKEICELIPEYCNLAEKK